MITRSAFLSPKFLSPLEETTEESTEETTEESTEATTEEATEESTEETTEESTEAPTEAPTQPGGKLPYIKDESGKEGWEAIKNVVDNMKEGDKVVVNKQSEARSGDIVLAYIDGGFTLKTLRKRNGEVWLEAANPKYPDFKPKETLEVFGVVRGIIRKV